MFWCGYVKVAFTVLDQTSNSGLDSTNVIAKSNLTPLFINKMPDEIETASIHSWMKLGMYGVAQNIKLKIH